MSDITELGRTARVYSELASRTEPTLSDVQLALVDAGRCNVQGVVTSLSPVEVFVTRGYQDFWSVKSVLDCLIVHFWNFWSLDFRQFKGQIQSFIPWFLQISISKRFNLDPGHECFSTGHINDYPLMYNSVTCKDVCNQDQDFSTCSENFAWLQSFWSL